MIEITSDEATANIIHLNSMYAGIMPLSLKKPVAIPKNIQTDIAATKVIVAIANARRDRLATLAMLMVTPNA